MSFVDELRRTYNENAPKESDSAEKRIAKKGVESLKWAAESNARRHINSISGYFYQDDYDGRYTFRECDENKVPREIERGPVCMPPMPSGVNPDSIKNEVIKLIDELKVEYTIKLIRPYEYDIVTVRGFITGRAKSERRNKRLAKGYYIYVSLKW